MITQREIETFKTFSKMQLEDITGGALYFTTDGEVINWSISSKNFKISALETGKRVDEQSCSMQAMNQGKTISMKLPSKIYGTRVLATSTPIISETSNEIIGAATIVFPRLHPTAAAFESFAPIISEMFSDGIFLYVSDLQKIIRRQASEKFQLSDVVVGYELKDTDIAFRTIKSKKLSVQEIEASKYGVPVLVMNYPLFDEDDANEVVGTLGMVIPKGTAFQLREMANTMDIGLGGVSMAVEQMAASASQIYSNECELNAALKEVNKLSDEIYILSKFIKEIAEQTNMLGLNASIEASRAGVNGRGFAVVANEIRKLSEQSKGTVPQIKEFTDSIKNKIDYASSLSETSLDSSQEQSSAVQQITATVEELNALAEELNETSHSI